MYVWEGGGERGKEGGGGRGEEGGREGARREGGREGGRGRGGREGGGEEGGREGGREGARREGGRGRGGREGGGEEGGRGRGGREGARREGGKEGEGERDVMANTHSAIIPYLISLLHKCFDCVRKCRVSTHSHEYLQKQHAEIHIHNMSVTIQATVPYIRHGVQFPAMHLAVQCSQCLHQSGVTLCNKINTQ